MEAIERSDSVYRERTVGFWLVFVSPLRTLESLCERPRWIVPLGCAALLTAVIDYYALTRIGFDSLVAAAARASGTLDPDGVVQNALAHRTEILAIQSVGSFLGVFATATIFALLLWLLVLGVGGEVTFKRVMAVMAHVGLVFATVKQSMLAFAVTLSQNPVTFDLKNPLATNIGFFVHSSSPMTARILSSLDLLTFTTQVLVVLGLVKVSRGLSRKAACAVVFIPWSLYVAFRAWMAGAQ